MLFYAAAAFFALFSVIYAAFVAAILYHVNHYTLPDRPAPRIIIKTFLILSGILWCAALYFLFTLR